MKTMIAALSATALVAFAGPAFADCGSGTSKDDVKACLSQELHDSDRRINAVYRTLMASRDDAAKIALRSEQRAWLRQRNNTCGLNSKEPDREKWLQAILANDAKTVCVVRYTFARVGALNDQLPKTGAAPQLPAAPQAPKFQPQAAGLPSGSGSYRFMEDGYALESTIAHAHGKWYFELQIDRGHIAQLGDVLFSIGVGSTADGVGALNLVNVRHTQTDLGPLNLAIAIDLDNGAYYARHNGDWGSQAPGSNSGIQLKLNQNYRVAVLGSSQLDAMIQQGLITVNLGEKPFAYAMPDGYRPFREP